MTSTLKGCHAGVMAGAMLILAQADAFASKTLSGEICRFDSSAVVFGGTAADPFSVTWNLSTGQVISARWSRGGEQWSSFASNPGTVQPEPSGAYYLVDIGMTTQGYEKSRYSFKGYVAINVNWPDATFAAVYEGTGTAWLGANGTVNCK